VTKYADRKSARVSRNPHGHAATGKKKGQQITVDLQLLVVEYGTELASVLRTNVHLKECSPYFESFGHFEEHIPQNSGIEQLPQVITEHDQNPALLLETLVIP